MRAAGKRSRPAAQGAHAITRRLLVTTRRGGAALKPNAQDEHVRSLAQAAQAASDTANLNWSHSVSDIRTAARSSEGSLYAPGQQKALQSTRGDWIFGFGLVGGLLMLIDCLNIQPAEPLYVVCVATVAGIAAGALAGALIHRVFVAGLGPDASAED